MWTGYTKRDQYKLVYDSLMRSKNYQLLISSSRPMSLDDITQTVNHLGFEVNDNENN